MQLKIHFKTPFQTVFRRDGLSADLKFLKALLLPTRLGPCSPGALIGDDVKIGTNAVTSPGTILVPRSVVRRLELVQQV